MSVQQTDTGYRITTELHTSSMLSNQVFKLIVDRLAEEFLKEHKEQIFNQLDITDITKNVQLQIQEETKKKLTNVIKENWI